MAAGRDPPLFCYAEQPLPILQAVLSATERYLLTVAALPPRPLDNNDFLPVDDVAYLDGRERGQRPLYLDPTKIDMARKWAAKARAAIRDNRVRAEEHELLAPPDCAFWVCIRTDPLVGRSCGPFWALRWSTAHSTFVWGEGVHFTRVYLQQVERWIEWFAVQSLAETYYERFCKGAAANVLSRNHLVVPDVPLLGPPLGPQHLPAYPLPWAVPVAQPTETASAGPGDVKPFEEFTGWLSAYFESAPILLWPIQLDLGDRVFACTGAPRLTPVIRLHCNPRKLRRSQAFTPMPLPDHTGPPTAPTTGPSLQQATPTIMEGTSILATSQGVPTPPTLTDATRKLWIAAMGYPEEPPWMSMGAVLYDAMRVQSNGTPLESLLFYLKMPAVVALSGPTIPDPMVFVWPLTPTAVSYLLPTLPAPSAVSALPARLRPARKQPRALPSAAASGADTDTDTVGTLEAEQQLLGFSCATTAAAAAAAGVCTRSKRRRVLSDLATTTTVAGEEKKSAAVTKGMLVLCSICQASEPDRMLFCGHLQCHRCLEELFKRAAAASTGSDSRASAGSPGPWIQCPTCRALVTEDNIVRVFVGPSLYPVS